MPEHQSAEVQQVLDELLREKLVPFALTAYSIDTNGQGEYFIPFKDSRIHSCRFSVKEGEDFIAVVRAAVLERVSRMDGPLLGKPTR
jgi:hypothetical protein